MPIDHPDLIASIPEPGEWVRTLKIPLYKMAGRRVGKVMSVHTEDLMLSVPDRRVDVAVDFGDGKVEILPHWKLKTISPLEALAVQADDDNAEA